MNRIIDDLVSDWAGYTEEYPDWHIKAYAHIECFT